MKSILIILFSLITTSVHTQVLINEIQSSNKNTISDYENDNPDWIELYNTGDTDINLKDFFISDNINEVDKWVFPDITIQANRYLIIYCSQKDTNFMSQLHTNFKLDQDGEVVILSKPDLEIIDQQNFDFIPSDQSWNRIPDGNDTYFISYHTTPGGENKTGSSIINSFPSGFYENGISLQLMDLNSEAEIRYSINGSNINTQSHVYSQALKFEDASGINNPYSQIPTTPTEGPQWLDDYIFKASDQRFFKVNVLKYQSFLNNKAISPVYNKSYFIGENIFEEFGYPVWSIVTDSLHLFDHNNGIFIPGIIHENTEWNGFWPVGNYSQRGRDWERPVHVSYFDKDGLAILETEAGLRMHGFGSASYAQKSMRLYFRSDYGKSKIEDPIFEFDNADYYKRLILRNSGNDFLQTHFRDALLQELIKDLNIETQNFEPSIVFINGEYWGIYNIRERLDKYYFDGHYNIEEDSLIVVKECGIEDHGDNSDYLDLLDFVSSNKLTVSSHYQTVLSQIDIDSYIDYHILQIYFANADWPCNNYKFWKTTAADSKWKPMVFDLDLSFGYSDNSKANFNTLEVALEAGSNEWPNCDCSTLLFRSLFENQSFRNKFIDRSVELFDSHFNPIRIKNLIDKYKKNYAGEIGRHIKRWSYPNSINDWENEIDQMITFASERPCAYFDHLKTYDLNLSVEDICEAANPMDQFVLAPNPSSGKFIIKNERSFVYEGALTIYNTFGQLLSYEDQIKIEAQEEIEIDLSQYAKGIYFLDLIEAGNTSTFKAIVH